MYVPQGHSFHSICAFAVNYSSESPLRVAYLYINFLLCHLMARQQTFNESVTIRLSVFFSDKPYKVFPWLNVGGWIYHFCLFRLIKERIENFPFLAS